MPRLKLILVLAVSALLAMSGVALADVVTGTTGDDDPLAGTVNRDIINGRSGDDVIFGLAKADAVTAGKGEDTIYGDGVCTPPDPSDPYNPYEPTCVPDGASPAGADLIFANQDDDTVFGGGGNDRVYGGKGDDELSGEAGNDRLFGNEGDDTVNGGPGNDELSGGVGKDTINGGEGNDDISSRDGNVDTITCGAGRDVVRADFRDKVATDCETVTRRTP